MKLFKERLRELAGKCKEVAIAFLIFGTLFGAGVGVSWLGEKYDIVITATIYIMLFVIAVAILGSLTKFLNWMFIEPFKSRKGEKK